jgi:mannonate dehydratase
MPLHELLGGKSLFAITTYCHTDGKTVEENSQNIEFAEAGWKHVRIQLGGYGSPMLGHTPDFRAARFGLLSDSKAIPRGLLRKDGSTGLAA